MLDLDKIPFVQSKHFTNTTGRDHDLIVDHLIISPEDKGRAEACIRMFATTTREASSHYAVDDKEIWQGVHLDDVAWAAPGGNSNGIQIEQAGTIQTPEQWKDDYSVKMIERSCELKAALVVEFGIPVKWREPGDLIDGRRGLTDHWRVTQAFHLSTHTDCGVSYPHERVLRIVAEMVDHDHNDHADEYRRELPTVSPGDTGWLVEKVQKHLIRHGYLIRRDGIYGAATERAVRRFQSNQDLPRSGVVDRRTWRRLRA